MAISDVFLQELHSKVDIEQVISPYVNLRRRGKNFVGLCPFHNEKTPSFTVYPDTQSFYCFGCGAGGDVITFVRRVDNLDYVEAVKTVAQMAGMSMPEDGFDDTVSKKRNRILSANREAARFFHSCLVGKSGEAALGYLLRRGLSMSTIRHFGLGYAPDSWHDLLNHMRSKGFTEQELYEANLVRKSEKEGRVNFYDNFRSRIMFPIIDLRGNVVAFGGRVTDDSKPKYINTSDTLVYKKSLGVYGLNFAKNSNSNRLILVEGYMDVIALHQAGFTEAIACLGTAFTREQANLLSRYANEILICYDSDEAGQKATQRALSVLNTTGATLRVIKLAGGKDPDEIIKTFGRDRFSDLLTGAANQIEYKLLRARESYDLSTDDGKMNFLIAASDVLATVGNIEKDIYASRLANELDVSKEAILSRVKSRQAYHKRKEKSTEDENLRRSLESFSDKNNPERAQNIRAARAEETLIASLMRNGDFYGKVSEKLSPDDFITAFNRRLYTCLCSKLEEGMSVELSFFASDFSPEEMDTVSRIFFLADNLANTLGECYECIEVLRQEKDVKVTGNVSEMSDEEYLKLFEKKST